MSTQNVAGDKVRPGLKSGRSTEFTLILPLKPGGAERMRKKNFGSLPNLGTVHEARWVIFDNDTKLLFASTFDGSWDAYMDDFRVKAPDFLDLMFGEVEGFAGIRDPNAKDFTLKHQVSSLYFYKANPEASPRDVEKALKIKGGLDIILDTAAS